MMEKPGRGASSKVRGGFLALLLVFMGLPLEAQLRPAELRFHVGSATFLESSRRVSAGTSFRYYLGEHGWAFEPEYAFMTEGSHQDNLLVMNVVKDITQPSRRSTLYMIMGGGMNFYRSRGRSEKGLEGLGWGMGLKIRAGDGFFISPQFRLGRGPALRFSFCLGFAPRR